MMSETVTPLAPIAPMPQCPSAEARAAKKAAGHGPGCSAGTAVAGGKPAARTRQLTGGRSGPAPAGAGVTAGGGGGTAASSSSSACAARLARSFW